VTREIYALRRVNTAAKRHPGRRYVRGMLDACELASPGGKHLCLVFEPLRESLRAFAAHFKGDRLPPNLLPLLVKPILQGLDFSHTECKLIHTGKFRITLVSVQANLSWF